jgi:phospholipase C
MKSRSKGSPTKQTVKIIKKYKSKKLPKKALYALGAIVGSVLLVVGIVKPDILHIFLQIHPTPSKAVAATTPLQHIVIIEKKSRSFDHYFGTFPGANGATTYIDASGVTHPLAHASDVQKDTNHSGAAQVKAIDGGKMDKFAANGLVQFYQPDIPNYWQYAKNFTLADNFFSMAKSPSFPNQLFLIAAQNNDAFENPLNASGGIPSKYGCDSPTGTTVKEWHADGSVSYEYPCFDFPTIGDTLNTAGIPWRFYQAGPKTDGYNWSSYDAIKHIRQTSQWQQHVVDYTQFAADAASGSLPAVSWVTEPKADADKPPKSVCGGENWLVSQLNTVMNNPTLWSSTAVIVSWDDWGGFYDHVTPPAGPTNTNLQYGLRIPVLIISPYAKAGTVDHNLYSFPSVLKFVEDNFNLPSLGTVDGQATSLMNAFNFTQPPLPPLTLQQRTCPI